MGGDEGLNIKGFHSRPSACRSMSISGRFLRVARPEAPGDARRGGCMAVMAVDLPPRNGIPSDRKLGVSVEVVMLLI